MAKYKVWRVENKENGKMAKYGEAKCGRKMTYLGHMSSVLDFVKC
jgi:hypothetical protein